MRRLSGLLLLAVLVSACGGPGTPPSKPTPIPPTPTSAPESLECPPFSVFALPVPLPVPVPVPGANVRGSPSPISPLARDLDRALEQAWREAEPSPPQRRCFFEIQAEGEAGVFVVYEFPSEPASDFADRLSAALRKQGIEASPMTVAMPGMVMAMLELRAPDRFEGGLLRMQRMAWAWAAPPGEAGEEATPTPAPAETAAPPEPTRAPPTVQPTGLAQEVDESLRPALEKALGVRLQLRDFTVMTMGPGSSTVFLFYAPKGALSWQGREEQVRQALTQLGLQVMVMGSPEGLDALITGGTLVGRTASGGTIHILSDRVEVNVFLQQ